jgi:hypothetical protein
VGEGEERKNPERETKDCKKGKRCKERGRENKKEMH